MKRSQRQLFKYTVTYDVPSGAKGRYIVDAESIPHARSTAAKQLASLGVSGLRITGVVPIKKGSRRK